MPIIKVVANKNRHPLCIYDGSLKWSLDPILWKNQFLRFFGFFNIPLEDIMAITIRPPKSKILLRLPGYVLSSVWKIETISSTASVPNWWIFGFGDRLYCNLCSKLQIKTGPSEHALNMAIFGFSESIWSKEWVKAGSHRNFWLFVKHYISWATLLYF